MRPRDAIGDERTRAARLDSAGADRAAPSNDRSTSARRASRHAHRIRHRDPETMGRLGFHYYSIGRASVKP